MTLLQKQGIIVQSGSLELLTNLAVIVAGSVLLMWVGELITEFGIGNGTSLIIFAGIVAGLPSAISQNLFLSARLKFLYTSVFWPPVWP